MKGPGESFYRELLDQMSDGVYFVDSDRRITYWNAGAERISGHAREAAIGTRCADNLLMHVDGAGNQLCAGMCPLAATMADCQPREAAVFLHHRDGHRHPVRVRTAPIRDRDGAVVGAVEVFSDDSEGMAARRRLEEMQQMALVDALTEVGNRRFVEMSLDSRLGELERYGWPLGVVFADVDRFKRVNDKYGHAVGDELLRVVAKTLASNCRSADVVGRWGGEEFVVILRNAGPAALYEAAERFRVQVRSSRAIVDTAPISVTISVGATCAKPGEGRDTLIRRADRLMYASKEAGRDRVTVG